MKKRIATVLRSWRVAAGMTQSALATTSGIARPNISRIEAGRHTPSLETIARLADATGGDPIQIGLALLPEGGAP